MRACASLLVGLAMVTGCDPEVEQASHPDSAGKSDDVQGTSDAELLARARARCEERNDTTFATKTAHFELADASTGQAWLHLMLRHHRRYAHFDEASFERVLLEASDAPDRSRELLVDFGVGCIEDTTLEHNESIARQRYAVDEVSLHRERRLGDPADPYILEIRGSLVEPGVSHPELVHELNLTYDPEFFPCGGRLELAPSEPIDNLGALGTRFEFPSRPALLRMCEDLGGCGELEARYLLPECVE